MGPGGMHRLEYIREDFLLVYVRHKQFSWCWHVISISVIRKIKGTFVLYTQHFRTYCSMPLPCSEGMFDI